MLQSTPVQTRWLLFFIFVLTLGTASTHAQVDPAISWRMIDTDHFTIIYDAKQEELGKWYARFAEQAFQSTVHVFGEHPSSRTVIFLHDAFDFANGAATPIPYPMIEAYPVLPTVLDNIGTYGNWGLELVTHEYTHVLNFTPAHGFWRPLRSVFGTIIAPGILLPRWYLEGTAVEMETRLSKHGRLRSPFYFAMLRAMSRDRTLHNETLARINEVSIPTWPLGNRPYLFGSVLISQLAQDGGGGEFLSELNQRYSRRFPFLLDVPVVDKLDLNYDEVFARVLTRLDHDTLETEKLVAMGGTQTPDPLPQDGMDNHSPAISPDGNRLAYFQYHPDHHQRIVLLERKENSPTPFNKKGGDVSEKRFFELKNAQKISWLPDSQQFVFDASDVVNRYYIYSDLFLFDLSTKKRKRLTRGLRATEPTVSPDGKWIVFRQNTPGGTRLARVSIDGQNFEVLYSPKIQVRVSRPEFISKNEVIFSEREQGFEFLRVLNLESKVAHTVLQDFATAQFPRWTSRGLLFMSEKSGIANLYLADRNLQSAVPVTNTLTRAVTPELDTRTGDLYFSHLTGTGFQIQRLSKADISKKVRPPQVPPPVGYGWPQYQEPQIELQTEPQEYSSWRYMYPHYWIPYIYSIEGGWLFQASTSGNDPLMKHSYLLNLSYDSIIHRPSLGASYTNTQTPVTIVTQYQDNYQYLYSSGAELHSTAASVLGILPLPSHWNSSWQAGAGWVYGHSEIPDYLNARYTTIYDFNRMGPTAVVQYQSVEQLGNQISPEKGGTARLQYSRFLNFGGDYKDYERYQLNANYFFSRWLPEHHVLMGSLTGIAQPALRSTLLGSANSAFAYQASLLNSDYLTRGYTSGEFIGRHLASATLEYRFPIWNVYQGGGTIPLFTRRLHGALIADAVTLDGAYYNYDQGAYSRTQAGRYFIGSGAELRSDFTFFYNLPATLVFGVYYASDPSASSNPVSFMTGFGL